MTSDGDLAGTLELPLAAGLLARIIAAVGLAQNFGALKALTTEGIQRGHMSLHAHNVAVAAGAVEHEVAQVARLMVERQTVGEESARRVAQQR